MSDSQSHLSVTNKGGVSIVQFSDRKILDELAIREIEEELFNLVDAGDKIKMLLNFQNVEHLSSAALSMLINLEKKIGGQNGKLMLSDINPQIFEVFKITRLNKMFDIYDVAADALKRF